MLLEVGETSIFHLFGPDYCLIDFSSEGSFVKNFTAAAKKMKIPLMTVHLLREGHIRDAWGMRDCAYTA